MNPVKIAPSLLAADFGNLQRDVEMVNNSEAHWNHLDIMDGVFVPNISYGMPVIKAIAEHATKPLDVHLMIIDPDRYISTFAALGADVLTVHYEACPHLHRTLQKIKGEGMKAGVAINPHTPVSVLTSIIQEIDLVCLMSVNPGYGGQKFIPHTFDKLRELKSLINETQSGTLIEIDGGVGTGNAAELAQAGADVLVAGSSVFRAEDPVNAVATLNGLVNP